MSKDKDETPTPETPWQGAAATPKTDETGGEEPDGTVLNDPATSEAISESGAADARSGEPGPEPDDAAPVEILEPAAEAADGTPSAAPDTTIDEAVVADEPIVADEPKRGSGGRAWLIALVVLVVLAGGGYLAFPYAMSRLADALLPASVVAALGSVEQTQGRLDSIEADVTELKGQTRENADALAALRRDVEALPATAAGAGDGDSAELAQRLDALAASLEELSTRVDSLTSAAAGATAGGMAEAAKALESGIAERLTAADNRAETAERQARAAEAAARDAQARLQALEQRLASLEQTPSRTPVDEQRAAVLALGQLRSAVDAGRPYGAALETVESVFASAEDLNPLRMTASSGIPTLGDLKARFPETIDAVLHARPQAGDIWERTLQRLSSLVTVRRVGDVPGQEADAVLARAEVHLGNSDLARAVDELKALDGPAAAAAGPWLRDAMARVEAERALDQLQDQAIAKTAGG